MIYDDDALKPGLGNETVQDKCNTGSQTPAQRVDCNKRISAKSDLAFCVAKQIRGSAFIGSRKFESYRHLLTP